MNKEKSMNTTSINDTVQDVGDATELTEGIGGFDFFEPVTNDYYEE